jgi:hypothetical protein
VVGDLGVEVELEGGGHAGKIRALAKHELTSPLQLLVVLEDPLQQLIRLAVGEQLTSLLFTSSISLSRPFLPSITGRKNASLRIRRDSISMIPRITSDFPLCGSTVAIYRLLDI